MCDARMNEDKKRGNYVVQTRLDPVSQDRLKWVQKCLAHVMPDVKTPSHSMIIRRALESYVNYLGQILTPQVRYPTVKGEQAHLLVASQNNRVYWENGVFPEDKVVDGEGNLVRFDMMERAARQEHNQRGIDALLKGGHGE